MIHFFKRWIQRIRLHGRSHSLENTNLKFLKIEDFETPFPWMEVLSHFPNLQALEACSENNNVYKAISTIRQHDPKMLKLKHIDVYCDDDCKESLRLVLLDPNLSLETIRLNLQHHQSKILVDILDLHAKSLKELQIYDESPRYPQTIPLSQSLEKLKILNIGFGLYAAGIFKYVPNARKVVMNNIDGHSSHSLSFDPNLRLDSCKELTFHFSEDWSTADLATFLNAFPNVEILETRELDNTAFSIIYERLTKLVSFRNILCNKVDVVGLLGFDPDSKVQNGIRKPNIIDLKDLQSFSMEKASLGSDAEIEIKCADVVLKELERLHHLKIFKLNSYKLTEAEIWEKFFAKYSGH